MLKTRVIPCLLLRDGGLVKTVKFDKAKYVGDPINAVKIFNEKEVDELIFIDIDATKQGREPDLSIIRDLTTECFMPFSYGGGIKTVDQIQKILLAGVEKVVLNQSALHNKELITQASKYFGSSTIIAAIDIKKNFWGAYKVYDHVKRSTTDLDPVTHAKQLEESGAGEIFINNVDRDGTYSGYDVNILDAIINAVQIPVIACGGASSLEDLKDLSKKTHVSGVAAGSLFVYQGPHRAVLISYPNPKQLEAIFS